jgi:hypothetical protein
MRMNERKMAFWLTGVVVAALAATTILWLYFIRVPTNVAYASEEDEGIRVIDLKSLKVVRRVHPVLSHPEDLKAAISTQNVCSSAFPGREGHRYSRQCRCPLPVHFSLPVALGRSPFNA